MQDLSDKRVDRKATYLDWAATARLHPAASAAMSGAFTALEQGEFANPSSQHRSGRAAWHALNMARERIARVFGIQPDSILFTSGGTEALSLALNGASSSIRIVGATEHAAVLDAAPEALHVSVDSHGLIDIDALVAHLSAAPEGALVAIQHANNETGVVQDIAEIARVVHAHGGRLLSDTVQSAGKLALPGGADFLTLSAHKLGGPAGIGALIVRCKDDFRGIQKGGGQEQGYRAGTENLPGILGFAAAVEAFDTGFPARAAALQAMLEQRAEEAGARINGKGVARLPNITNLHLPGVAAATQLIALDMAGVAVSQGPACSSGTLKPSQSLLAMGLGDAASQSLRISTGWITSEADIEAFLAAWLPLAKRRAA